MFVLKSNFRRAIRRPIGICHLPPDVHKNIVLDETLDRESINYIIQCPFRLKNLLFQKADPKTSVPGKFKDEMKGNIMTEFIGLRSKLYSFKYEDPYDENDHENVLIHLRDLFNEKSHKEKKVCKGIKRCVIENKLNTDDYNDVLINKKQLTRDMNLIKSKHHKVNTINVSKIALSCFDNKRYILDDGITSLAYGHYFLK